MPTRNTDKEPEPEDKAVGPSKKIKKRKTSTKRSYFHGNKVTCERHKAVAAFYKVKDWVELNEPEFSKPSSRRASQRRNEWMKFDLCLYLCIKLK